MGVWISRMIQQSVFDKRLLNLQSCAYLGYYYRRDLQKVIGNLSVGVDITPDLSKWNLDTTGYLDILKMWQDANFNPNSIKWTNYYPDSHYDKDLEEDVAFYLRLNGVHRSWISKVDPGYYAPWHWDVDDNENLYLQKGEIKRYSIMLDTPAVGHIFILGNDYLYNTPQGSIFKWNLYKDWHAGINAGLTSKYMFHILGY